MYSNKPEKLSDIDIVCFGGSDHNIIRLTRFTKSKIRRPKFITKRSFKNFDKEVFLGDIGKIAWFDLFMSEDPDKAASMLTTKIPSVLDTHAPVKTFQVRKNFAPWLSKETKKIMDERNSAKNIAAHSNNQDDHRLYKNLKEEW